MPAWVHAAPPKEQVNRTHTSRMTGGCALGFAPLPVNKIRQILTNFDRQYFAAIFTENLRVVCILVDR
jgi:hypothetical protein